MTTYALIVESSEIKLWGLSSSDRLARQIKQLKDCLLVEDVDSIPENSTVLCLLGTCVFETRVFEDLLEHINTVVFSEDKPAAGYCRSDELVPMLKVLRREQENSFSRVDHNKMSSYMDKLRKAEPPLCMHLSKENTEVIENNLYGRSYKGITDLVTKWLWPKPAKKAVRICIHLGISPNMLTLIGIFLVVYASYAFYEGYYVSGLVAGWVMTFLDTVDGKLARVSIQSSRLGHVLDHGTDIIHPPFWYLFWAISIPELAMNLSISQFSWVLFGGYIAGRFAEQSFHLLGSCTLFDWRPFDSYFRLITARRNPCLIILTVSLIFSVPGLGILAVAAWTVLTTFILLIRLMQGVFARRNGRLVSWLVDTNALEEHPRAFQLFSRTVGAYEKY